jgi:arylsulfatase A-like enzyme
VKDEFDQAGIVYALLKRAFFESEKRLGFNPGTPTVPAKELSDRAIAWAEQAVSGPRFMWVHYMDVHHPYSPPRPFQLLFRDECIKHREAIRLRRKMLEKPTEITEDELQILIDLYDAEIRYVDTEAFRLIQAVESAWDSDVVTIFTADHGDEFLDHGRFSHSDTLYDELIHVPLFIRDQSAGKTHDDIVELLDISPTICDYANTTAPESWEGASLRRIPGGDGKADTFTVAVSGSTYSYRDNDWKFIERTDDVELYDLQSDPSEVSNVVDEYPEIVDNLSGILENYRARVATTGGDENDLSIDGKVQDRLEQLGYKI